MLKLISELIAELCGYSKTTDLGGMIWCGMVKSI
jgi:hypothetical protein